ncbi:MAG: site-2 protease family protein [Drouetiella hepatica Uher 2000/2452]|jgi:membrane-associated protease RseP (regulator of RpoE activity)|uniref:Site-2 protease family protein n=1 Tax=Drouetiella hepatica Uher 2000/2452 TaxID=904376 RepID=A0A951Q8T1_9CYAN|nr:site-2 protease family protein [Drouetiella hepatica Uher 2000/2452]
MITAVILLVALALLGWGFYRALPLGKPGVLAWLQSVALMLPWFLFFGLSAVGTFINLAEALSLLVGSTLIYIALGRWLRDIVGNDPEKYISPAPTPPLAQSPPPPVAQAEPVQDATPALPAADLQTIRGIFGVDTFFAVEAIPYQAGVIFKGNLRGEPQSTHERLSVRLKERLDDRYRLFLVEGMEDKPVVVVLPSSSDPKPATVSQIVLAIGLGVATIATCLETAGLMLGFDLLTTPARLLEVLPIGAGILLTLAVHEIGHLVLAKRYQAQLLPPFFLPVLQIGSFGAITRFASLLPSRTALFDIAFAGPAVGGLTALGMLIAGLLLSHQGSYFQLPSEFFQGSLLVGLLAKVALGNALQQPVVDVHPLVVIGWLGLVMTAINLLPAGQLDGGRILQSIYGRKVAARTTIGTLIVVGLAALVNPLALYWAIAILFLQRDLERPALNELTEPNDARAALGLLILFVMAATLLPLTPSLASRLGIGG